MMMTLRRADRVVTNPDRIPVNKEDRDKQIVGYVLSTLKAYQDSRKALEDIWQESWASYFGTPYALAANLANQLITVGNVNVEWRHRINLGKAFSTAEDIHSQLMQAAFPTSEPFDVQPLEPSVFELVRLLRKYYGNKLHEWNFKSHFGNYLRQLIVLGSSCMAIPWSDSECVEFLTQDMFDIYLDPTDSADKSPLIRRVFYTKAQLLLMAEKGEIDVNIKDILRYAGDDLIHDEGNKEKVLQYQGITLAKGYCPFDKIPVYEFWGNVELTGVTYFNRVVKVMGEKLLKFEENPYDAGRPFVVGSYIPVIRQPYGIGALQASLGIMHTMNIITNQRLDNVELMLAQMYTVRADGITRAEEVTSTPGRSYEVNDHDDIRPLPSGNVDLTGAIIEVNELEKNADKNTGAGPLVGSGPPRGGERVTAEEIRAIQNAGGSRLVNVFAHIETTSIEPMLQKTMLSIVQFVQSDEIVAVSASGGLGNEYYQIGPTELRGLRHKIRARTASYILQRQELVDRMLQYVQFVMSVPGFAEKVNLDKLLYDITVAWGFDDPEGYLIAEQDKPRTLSDTLQSMGGQPLEQGVAEQLAADGGRTFFQRMTGQPLPEGVQVNDIFANLAASKAQLSVDPGSSVLGAPDVQ